MCPARKPQTSTMIAYEKADHKARRLLTSLEKGPAYEKEKVADYADLKQLIDEGDAMKDSTPFFQAFMVKEAADIKLAFPNEAELELKLNEFAKTMGDSATALNQKRIEILNVVKARTASAAAKKQKAVAKGKAKA